MLVAQFAQPGQMDAQQAEHDGDALIPPIVHAPDATQPGAHRVEPQQAPFPETLSWYLHHFDDQIHPGAALMTVQVADKSPQFKVVGKVQDMAFNHLCQERWAEAPSGNTYRKYLSPLRRLKHCIWHGCRLMRNNRCCGSPWLAWGTWMRLMCRSLQSLVSARAYTAPKPVL
jgi:hypothetical protein